MKEKSITREVETFASASSFKIGFVPWTKKYYLSEFGL